MSRIESLLYSAMEHGQKDALLKEVTNIRNKYPRRNLDDVYDEAYQSVMKT
tara:strand:+ start:318 stop:470 length:153 start_codon:yes stop_codon:yes gene_type:complete